ncbi:hypothetical protein D3C72_1864800 [compost metagenome]
MACQLGGQTGRGDMRITGGDEGDVACQQKLAIDVHFHRVVTGGQWIAIGKA